MIEPWHGCHGVRGAAADDERKDERGTNDWDEWLRNQLERSHHEPCCAAAFDDVGNLNPKSMAEDICSRVTIILTIRLILSYP